jgi:pilus assembly protein Flp/PilA
MKKLICFFKEEDGATAVEYALMVALIAAVVIGAVTFLGTSASDSFKATADSVAGTVPAV